MSIIKRSTAELVGTFWLVLRSCGSAVLSAVFPQLGIGFLEVAFAFGLTVLTMCYAIGHISGGLLNPAVFQGWAAQLWLFWLAPILGGAAAGFFYSWCLAE